MQNLERPIDDELRVFKYHALGNSYLIIDPRYMNGHAELLCVLEGVGHLPANWLVKHLCSKGWGIGSNGLLFGPIRGTGNVNAPFELALINSDGTMAGLSGNGLRIFSKYLIDAGYVENRRDQTIAVDVVERNSSSSPVIRNSAKVRIVDTVGPNFEVAIDAPPRLGPEAVDANMQVVRPMTTTTMRRRQLWYCVAGISELVDSVTMESSAWDSSALVNIGNPHCVTFVHAAEHIPDMDVLQSLSEKLRPIAYRPLPGREGAATFAQGCNLQWAFVDTSSCIYLSIFERGEGPTAASGSSASAAAIAAFSHGLTMSNVEVVMPGGTLKIQIKGTPENIQSVTMTGSATRVLDGKLDLAEFVAAIPDRL